MNELQATILDIQRMSTEDGPGLRTTVFFKGCSLHCSWCHNPESIDPCAFVEFRSNRCMGCGECLNICPLQEKCATSLCGRCFKCVDACPTGARVTKGENWTVEKLCKELLKDKAYFGSDGGITLSGGEAVLQKDFVIALLQKLRECGVSTALDTAGQVPWESLYSALPFTDLLLYDIKIYNNETHKRHTGCSNDLIFENFHRVMRENTRIWVRTPIIPGASDSEKNIKAIAAFLCKNDISYRIEKWELCAFNNLCLDKYERLGEQWEFKDAKLVPTRQMEALCAAAKAVFPHPERVFYSGMTAD